MAARPLEIGEVGARVAAEVGVRRRRRGWDQAELADRVSAAGRPMSLSVLGKLEAGTRRVDVDDLAVLARVLEVEVTELLGDLGTEGSRRLPAGPIETSVHDDVEALGELAELDGMAPALAQIAYRLARELDYGGGEGGKTLHSLAKELRAVLGELRNFSPEEPPDDDDLGDLAAPA